MARFRGPMLRVLAEALVQDETNAADLYRRSSSLHVDDTRTRDADVTPFEHESDTKDVPLQSSASDSSFPTTFVLIVTIGFMILSGLVFVLVLRRLSRKDTNFSDGEVNSPPENSRFCMKRTTFTVQEASPGHLDETTSSRSVVAVLGGNTSNGNIVEVPRLELKLSWDEINAAGCSNRQSSRPAASLLIDAPGPGREFIDSQAASDNSSQTDDYSIDMLESPASTEYSFSSERDNAFLSPCWDVDSYRSTDCTFLSTTSTNVFRSNRGRNNGVYGPGDTPPISSELSPLSSGVFFVQNVDSAAVRQMRLDSRSYGARANTQMHHDIEV